MVDERFYWGEGGGGQKAWPTPVFSGRSAVEGLQKQMAEYSICLADVLLPAPRDKLSLPRCKAVSQYRYLYFHAKQQVVYSLLPREEVGSQKQNFSLYLTIHTYLAHSRVCKEQEYPRPTHTLEMV